MQKTTGILENSQKNTKFMVDPETYVSMQTLIGLLHTIQVAAPEFDLIWTVNRAHERAVAIHQKMAFMAAETWVPGESA